LELSRLECDETFTSLSIFGEVEVKLCFDSGVLVGESLALLTKDEKVR